MDELQNIKKFKHICIIQTAFLGDVALTLPLAEAIKRESPDTFLSFVTTSQAADVVSSSPYIDLVIPFHKRTEHKGLSGVRHLSSLLKEKSVDCIIAPHRSLRTTLITYLTKPEYSVGFDKSILSCVFKKRIKYYLHQHEIERNLNLLTGFSNKFDKSPKKYPF